MICNTRRSITLREDVCGGLYLEFTSPIAGWFLRGRSKHWRRKVWWMFHADGSPYNDNFSVGADLAWEIASGLRTIMNVVEDEAKKRMTEANCTLSDRVAKLEKEVFG